MVGWETGKGPAEEKGVVRKVLERQMPRPGESRKGPLHCRHLPWRRQRPDSSTEDQETTEAPTRGTLRFQAGRQLSPPPFLPQATQSL